MAVRVSTVLAAAVEATYPHRSRRVRRRRRQASSGE
jgi:hypothetical protein